MAPHGLQELVLLGTGMYFGELALLRGEPRAATAIAVAETDVLVLEREHFNQLLGPLQAILEQAASTYGPSSVKRVRPLCALLFQARCWQRSTCTDLCAKACGGYVLLMPCCF